MTDVRFAALKFAGGMLRSGFAQWFCHCGFCSSIPPANFRAAKLRLSSDYHLSLLCLYNIIFLLISRTFSDATQKYCHLILTDSLLIFLNCIYLESSLNMQLHQKVKESNCLMCTQRNLEVLCGSVSQIQASLFYLLSVTVRQCSIDIHKAKNPMHSYLSKVQSE